MSSDYLENIKDKKETVALLTMHASGFAELVLVEKDIPKEDADCFIEKWGDIVSFHLEPNEDGWNNAEKIASALTEWVRHSKSLQN